MIIKKNSINVSFYLATPQAKTDSQVYVSISIKSKSETQRLRFPTGESFITAYCHHRKQKNGKELLRRNTTFYMEYKSILDKIRDSLFEIAYTFHKTHKDFSLEDIKHEYYLKAGLIEVKAVNFNSAFNSYINANRAGWSEATITKVNSTLLHLETYQKAFGEIELQKFDIAIWDKLKNEYFVKDKKFSNSTSNKYLSFFKQFLKYSKKQGFIKNEIDLEDFDYLEEIEPFKIALKMPEVETLISLDLSNEIRLDKVRDLFLLEVMTGQRFSDTHKLLDKNNISDSSITIYQQKTGEKVAIPLHPKLKKHLTKIFEKYPEGLPVISNQKFNEYLTEVCIKAGFDRKHSWYIQTGKQKIEQTDFRYNLISSHSGRRSFSTLALAAGINSETIMKVTGHKKYDQFRQYVKVDDADVNEAFGNKFMNDKK